MNKIILGSFILFFLATSGMAQKPPQSNNGSQVITYTQQILVSKLDPHLSKTPLIVWLKNFVSEKEIRWEVNDCGETDGSGKQENVPMCGVFIVPLSEGRTFWAYISVGSMNKGIIKNDPSFPHIFWAFIQNSGKSEIVDDSSLSALPGLVLQ